ncbi:MAG: RNA methyltransferase [Bacteroidales bacterium]|nr:RNA methyltransferase [Bacteroidales bacterium]
MISKNKLKEFSKYKTSKFCDEDNVFAVEGTKIAAEALQSEFEIVAICALESWFVEYRTLIRKKVSPENTFEVTTAELERISTLKTPNQVWMLIKRQSNNEAFQSETNLTIVLDKIQDPGNLGTIIRTCDWFGIRNIVCSPDTVSCYNSKVVQASMGGIFRTNINYTPLLPFLDSCTNNNTPIYGALLDGENIYNTQLPTSEAVLVIGNESKGISDEVIAKITNRLTIPNIGGSCESLNASVANGIICYEFARLNSK